MPPELTHSAYIEHYILNAVIFLLAGVRYFWGDPNDMLRLGLFLTVGFSVIGDMDFYYQWPLNLPTFGLGKRETISKCLLILTLVVDLGRDYYKLRFRRRLKELASFVKE